MKPSKIQYFLKHDVNHNLKEFIEEKKSFNSRKQEVMAIRSKYPNKIPLKVERYHREKTLPQLEKNKFLVPDYITMSQFLVIIRNRIKLSPTQSLFLIINNTSILSLTLTMAEAYEHFSDLDGFLYITYASQDSFGYHDDIGSAQEVEAIRHRFPNKIPLYVSRYEREREVPALGRNKFLVPQELTMSQFLYIISTKLKLRDTQSLYLLVNDKVLVSHSLTMAQAYEQFRGPDGYLHITYAAQQVFG
ncbi:uncharacterized protein LOC113239474 [Hyposmocoma kahamanoa]|uniref:uncharacterized protein LOC113239474 n=1 Tax=Hyposmocoma kahamanoa TaxID=1477025 RepID=UPI000E6D5BC9|nr:uncharacterized protein LOC113239474 [Hyposmocoma kahamanoa]